LIFDTEVKIYKIKSETFSSSDPMSVVSGHGVESIAKNAGYLFGSTALTSVVRFFYVIALAHYLGPELYGLLGYGISWYLAFLSITGLGIFTILSKEIGRDKSRGVWIASATLTVRSLATIICALACGILGWLLESKPEVRILLIVFSVALIGRSIAMWTQAVFTAYEANQYTFRLQVIFRTFEVVVGVTLLIVGQGALTVAIVHAISWWSQALGGLIVAQRRLLAVRLNKSWQDLKYIVSQGIIIGLGVIMAGWLLRGPLVLFRHFGGSENSLGQLALAMNCLGIVASVPVAAAMASLPVLSRSVARRDGKELIYTETTIRIAMIFGTVAGLAGLGAGPQVVDLIFGSRYLEAGYLLGLVMWLSIPFSCATTINRVYWARGEYFLPMVCSGVGASVFTLCMPLLVANMSAVGALLATGAGMGVWALSLIWVLARTGDLDFRQALLRPLAIIFFSLGVFLAFKMLSSWLALLASWIALFFTTLQFGGITDHEKQLLSSLKSRLYSQDLSDPRQSGS
jgi:O-antigen/teichoic acid export membrane protein